MNTNTLFDTQAHSTPKDISGTTARLPTDDNLAREQRYARALCAQLTPLEQRVDHDISERLRVMRMAALARPAVQTASAAIRVRQHELGFSGNAGAGGNFGASPYAQALRWLLPAAALSFALFLMSNHYHAQDSRQLTQISKIASLDGALLSDPLPPSAYDDPAFMEYMKRQLAKQN